MLRWRAEVGRDEEQESWWDSRVKHPAHDVYKTYVLEGLLRRHALPPSKDGRHIPLRPVHDQHLVDERRGHAYISNHIRSSRYTIYDFLPKQILFQATRLANFYLICIGIPQTIPGLSTTGNYTTILPLLFFILLTVLKEGYDDYRRHRLDVVENKKSFARALRDGQHHRLADRLWADIWQALTSTARRKRVARNDSEEDSETDHEGKLRWTSIQWQQIKVGDILKFRRDEPVPADVVLLYADGENGLAYVETMALDGETSLKGRQALPALRSCRTIEGIKACRADFVVEDPNKELYDFNGRVTVGEKTIPLTLNEVLLRGTVLRNTGFAIGMVINTGEECKIRMNANHHPKAKKPYLEHFSNQIVLTLIFYMVVLSFGCSGGYLLWHRGFETKAWYLNNAYVSYKEIIVGFLIMFNNVIPLALYVSLEITKIGQMLLLNSDIEMYDEVSKTPMRCNTNTILENLGQVSYILSDKTGTLTENVMKFRKISIAGTVWRHEMEVEAPAIPEVQVKQAKGLKGDGGLGPPQITVTARDDSDSSLKTLPETRLPRPSLSRRSTSRSRSRHRNAEAQSELDTAELLDFIRQNPLHSFSKKAHEFLLGVALCHTCLPEIRDGVLDFQASSPDELALVRAAQDLGLLVVERTSQAITLQTSGADGKDHRDTYEVLDVIEFSSKRKRMSVVVRCPDGKIWLLCKGADSVIIPRLDQADLAQQKASDVKKSADIERALQRKSMQVEGRPSFGGRPSLTIRRKSSIERVRRPSPLRAKSFEVRDGGSTEKLPKPSITVRGTSLDISRIPMRGRGSLQPPSPIESKFDFLSDPSLRDDSKVFTRCFQHLDEFASDGLRTLIFAHKYIMPEDYAVWKKQYQAATTSLSNRQMLIEEAAEAVEQSLSLLGASAIEDKLQPGVPETIEKLRRAGIKIWMLTGDKRETAINIAHSASICLPGSDIFVFDIVKGDLEGQIRHVTEDVRSGACTHSVAVIDGNTLAAVEDDPVLRSLFFALIPDVHSVICCRASPAQKASIVKAIRARVKGALTLAIGDGANDLAMIQASHVGVGISGKEGLQASRVADYSIAQFRFLQRLLLVHGRWNYDRTAKFILWTFWKEMFFYMTQALYQRHNGYTGTSLYESWSLTVLNTLFTSLCVIAPGMYEQDLRADTLLAIPELYAYGQKNRGLNLPRYLFWMAAATAEGMIVWFVSWAAYAHFSHLGAIDQGLFALGDLNFSLAIMWTNTKLLIIETHYKSVIILGSFFITTGGWWAWNGFMSGAYNPSIQIYNVRNGFAKRFGADWTWWLSLILVLLILVTIELMYKFLKRNLIVAGMWPPWRYRREQASSRERRLEQIDLELWQEIEQNPETRKRLARMARGDDEEDQDEVEEVDLEVKVEESKHRARWRSLRDRWSRTKQSVEI